MKLFLAAIAILFSMNVHAAQTSVLWRITTHSCGYFSNQTVDIKAYYNDVTLPKDATVKLIYGFGNKEQKRDWERRQEAVATVVGLSNDRVAEVSMITQARGYPEHYKLFQFVWEIRQANGLVTYDQGGESTWGFYEANIWNWSSVPCSSPGVELAPLAPLEIHSIDRE